MRRLWIIAIFGLAVAGCSSSPRPQATGAGATTTVPTSGNSGIGPTTTTTNGPLALGQSATLIVSQNGQWSVTVDRLLDPAKSTTGTLGLQVGYRWLAVHLVAKNVGQVASSEFAVGSTIEVYDPNGQGFQTTIGDLMAGGPSFPNSQISLAPGGSADGWVLFQLPVGDPPVTVTFSPDYGLTPHATWALH